MRSRSLPSSCFMPVCPASAADSSGSTCSSSSPGFLITGLLWREASGTGTVALARFYGARARRLLPAAATVLVATCIASAVLLPPLQARSVIGDGIASALYVGNYRFAIGHRLPGFRRAAVAAPALLVAGRGGAVLPALAGIDHRNGMAARRWAAQRTGTAPARSAAPYVLVLALLAAVSFMISLSWTDSWPSWAFFSLPTRAWELAAGGLVALTAGAWRQLPGPVRRGRGLGRARAHHRQLHAGW